ncbi:hypothetical protein SISSUDRAFT_1067716 [Sistotremastrum suecicum HHB10207 ss-3]|uniref:Uncharacterized protein n=1 Tax=Sistotremastrum suecicum HHB10207 ss-3 TaxID=1314776 RepID=A0A165WT30_9AGAM|nr:hypothetical protein SISSUDRAFT_1067716 [Sistotremastrum suecicum HHB10207 ss-3]
MPNVGFASGGISRSWYEQAGNLTYRACARACKPWLFSFDHVPRLPEPQSRFRRPVDNFNASNCKTFFGTKSNAFGPLDEP